MYKVESFPRTGFFTLYAIPLFLIGGICVKKKWKIKSWQSIILIAIGLIECLFEAVVITRTTGELFGECETFSVNNVLEGLLW